MTYSLRSCGRTLKLQNSSGSLGIPQFSNRSALFPGGGDISWQSFTLKNSILSKIAENVSRTGLASVEEVYLTIIPPLSKFRRLPDTGVAIEYASQQAKMYELSAEWDRASQSHL